MARIFLAIRARTEAELWLIGSGEEMDAVRSLFRKSAFEDDVVYLGLRSDVAFLLRQVDLLLMTSLHESFSLVALEAMACGLPVVTTDVGGNREVVCRPELGTTVPFGDRDALGAAIVEVFEGKCDRELIIEHARLNVWDTRITALIESFTELLREPRPL